MDAIVFQVAPCEDSNLLVASWDDSQGAGCIATQGRDLRELQEQIADAVHCHFDPAALPKRIRLHFTADPVLTTG